MTKLDSIFPVSLTELFPLWNSYYSGAELELLVEYEYTLEELVERHGN